MQENRTRFKIVPHTQYLLNADAPIPSVFTPGDTPRHPYSNEFAGMSATLKGNGYCSLTRYNLFNVPSTAVYSVDEVATLWDENSKNGNMLCLSGGEWWLSKATELSKTTGYGYILGEFAKTYASMGGLLVRLMDLTRPSGVFESKDVEIEPTHLYLIEVRVRPKNPVFTRRKRLIVPA